MGMENTKNDAVTCGESQPSQENSEGVGAQAKIPDGGEDGSWNVCENETEKGLRETRPSPQSKKIMKHALRQQAKRRRKNTTIAAGNPAPIQRHALSPTTCDIEEVNCDTACYRQPTMAEVLASIPGFSMKPRKRSQKKLSAAAQLEQTKEGCVDLETPDSILVNSNLRSLLNKHTFTSLPSLYQYKLLQLLPHVDRTGNDSVFRLSGSGLNNEFFSRACLDWRDRLSEGEFTPENQAKIKAEQEKEKSKLDPWKLKHFEPTWGESLREWPSHPVSTSVSPAPVQSRQKATKPTPVVTRLRTVGAVTRAVTSYREKRAALSPPRQIDVKRNRHTDSEKIDSSKEPKEDVNINDTKMDTTIVDIPKTESTEILNIENSVKESQNDRTDDNSNSRKPSIKQELKVDATIKNSPKNEEHINIFNSKIYSEAVEEPVAVSDEAVIDESLKIESEDIDMTQSNQENNFNEITESQSTQELLVSEDVASNYSVTVDYSTNVLPFKGEDPKDTKTELDVCISASVDSFENSNELSETHNFKEDQNNVNSVSPEEETVRHFEHSFNDITPENGQLTTERQPIKESSISFENVETPQRDYSVNLQPQQITGPEILHNKNIQQFVEQQPDSIRHQIEQSKMIPSLDLKQEVEQPQELHHDIQPQILQHQMGPSAELLQQLEQPQLLQQQIQQPQLLQQIGQSHQLQQQFEQSQLLQEEHSRMLQQEIDRPQFLQQLEQPQILQQHIERPAILQQQIETLHQQMEQNSNQCQQMEQAQTIQQQMEPLLKSNVLMMPQVMLDVQQVNSGSVKSEIGHCLPPQHQNVSVSLSNEQNNLDEINTVITIPVSNKQTLPELHVVNESTITNVPMMNEVILSDTPVSSNQIVTERTNVGDEKWEVIQVNPGEKEGLYFKEDEAAILAAAWDVVGSSSHFQDLQQPVSVIPCQEELEVRLHESSLPAPQWADYTTSSDKQQSGHVKLELEVTLTPEVDSQVSSSSAEGTSEPVRVIPPTTIVCLPPLTASAPPPPPPSASSSALPYLALTTSTPVRAVPTKPLQTKSGGGRGGRSASNKPPPGAVNLERSYQICQAVIQNSPNRHQLRCQLKPPPALLGKRLQQPPPRQKHHRPQAAVFLRHMITSNSGGIPVNMAVLPSHPSHVGGVRRSNSAPPSNSESPACGGRGRPASVGGPALSCACSLRPLVPCKRCGDFCHEECITSARLCITCHSA